MNKQIQIVKIENGWIVAYVDEGKLKVAALQQQQVVPSQVFCKDYDAVCAVLQDQMMGY